MDTARFNFSHGTHEEHKRRFDDLVKLRERINAPISTILDTKGPEIRLKTFKDGKTELITGQKFKLTTKNIEGTNQEVSITYKDLPKDVSVGGSILIDDGLVELEIVGKSSTSIDCIVKNDGVISDQKGVNVPGTHISMPYISAKDREDIIFGIKTGFDFIAASFVSNAEDILRIRSILEEFHCKTINIIAKIENQQGVNNIDEIIKVSDGIMIARGDMGIELPLEDVPVIQKKIIKKVYNAGKQVITATQMLDSMIYNPRPTRAETTDVANAIYDGTSAIMLSGETAAGKYPVEALKMMIRIAERTENDIDYKGRFLRIETRGSTISEAISHATCMSAIDLKAKAIVTVTKSGSTARQISKFRPACPIMGCTPNESSFRQLNLSWGIKPLLIKEEKDTFKLLQHAVDAAKNAGYVNDGDLVIITAGIPIGIAGNTNLLKVHIVGKEDM
jgi:pyruvate kinase